MKSTSIPSKDTRIQTKSRLRENVEAIVVAIILALFIRTFIVQAFKIPSGSMKETLQIGDHILVNKFIYGVKLPYLQSTLIPIKNPSTGDIVVFEFPEDKDKDFIKRVVGVAGDVVDIRNKQVWVNGAAQKGSFIVNSDPHVFPGNLQPRDNFGPVTVPEHSLFVMGDNRDHSYDSRYWGFVNLKAVKGKAFIIYWSWDKDNFGVRWGRLGNILK
ncbi:MAG: signal peptidase I [Desulfatirhabdiaceae bacterium]|nr:signal peptidase I [Desulfatirhabdiaceae bacterium]